MVGPLVQNGENIFAERYQLSSVVNFPIKSSYNNDRRSKTMMCESGSYSETPKTHNMWWRRQTIWKINILHSYGPNIYHLGELCFHPEPEIFVSKIRLFIFWAWKIKKNVLQILPKILIEDGRIRLLLLFFENLSDQFFSLKIDDIFFCLRKKK